MLPGLDDCLEGAEDAIVGVVQWVVQLRGGEIIHRECGEFCRREFCAETMEDGRCEDRNHDNFFF